MSLMLVLSIGAFWSCQQTQETVPNGAVDATVPQNGQADDEDDDDDYDSDDDD